VRVVAVVNRKGGVGKTTTAVNLAAALALAGGRTLLIDLDPQGSVGAALAIAVEDGAGTSAAFASRPRLVERYPTRPELFRLGVVAADLALATVEHELLSDRKRGDRLGRALAGVDGKWVTVVIDTPPALGGLADAALRAADAVVVPVAGEYLAVDALRATLSTVRAAEKHRGRGYAPLAILPTFADARRSGSRAAIALLRDTFGADVLAAEVSRSARFDSASLAGVPLVLAAPTSEPALAYTAASRELESRLGAPKAPPPRRSAVKGFVRADMRAALRSLRPGGGP
jgi:chromosome partitioning protein